LLARSLGHGALLCAGMNAVKHLKDEF